MKNKLNKEFEDLAWSQMQKMLDQEMPVAEKKRRWGLLWLFLLSGLVSFGGGFYYVKNKKENIEKAQIVQPSNKDLIVENTPINSINTIELNRGNKDKLIANLSIKNIENNKTGQQIITQSSVVKTEKLQSYFKSATENTNVKTASVQVAETGVVLILPSVTASDSAVANKPIIETSKPAQPDSSLQLASGSSSGSDSGSASSTSDSKPQTPPQYVSENKENYEIDKAEQGAILTKELVFLLIINKLGSLKSDEVQVLALGEINTQIFEKIKRPTIVKNKFNPKTHFSFILGAHTEGVKKVDGGQIGIITHTYLDRKWSFFAGLNYRKTTVQVDSSSAAVVGYQAVGTTTTTNVLTKDLSLIPVKKIILNQLNYLELPIGFNYAFRKNMSVSMGIKTAYLLSTKVNISADSSVFFLKEMSQKSGYGNDPIARNSVTQLGLQRWDFGAIGGLNYSPLKRLQLGIRYDFGINSVVKRANWTAYNRFLGVNVVYLLK